MRRELMALVSEMASRSGLKPDQLAAELPNAFARLTPRCARRSRNSAGLMENEPGIAPVRRDRRGGRRVGPQAGPAGGRPGAGPGAGALRRGHPRAHRRRSSAHAATGRPCPSSAATSPRPSSLQGGGGAVSRCGQGHARRPTSRARRAGSRWPVARCSCTAPISSPTTQLREAIRLLESEALPRFEQIVPTAEEHKGRVAATTAIVLANIADAQTSLGGRLPGYDGAKMMVDARGTYRKALDRVKIEDFPDLAMDILNRRSQRDLEFGRRIENDRGRGHFCRSRQDHAADPVDPGRQAGLQGRARPHAQQPRQRPRRNSPGAPTARKATS